MRLLLLFALFLLGMGHGPAAAAETYELLFRSTALKGLEAVPGESETGQGTIVYDKVISGTDVGQAAGSFGIGLKIKPDGNVAMTLHQGTRSRALGNYPASVGNPLIMYFLESVLADIAAQSGGSPFYMRNRIKEALLRDADVVPVSVHYQNREVAAREVTIRPFTNDKAREKMGRFAELALAVTVSEDIPGWYYSLVATVPAAAGGAEAGYTNAITLKQAGEEQP
ncbi:hypothetical protein GGE07_003874 [Sinorhizobium terangae]|uniref:DUF3108 domain-containing protein n=1 Tax=Sinorhizobium terangae TaxID=110322 RepID=A0A6N7LA26_SINTE|nr:hypothetical protein [Sinorhizobium terangae]MBB4187210.1 hypothetical protein [Sinorhizobium terangae]MQX14757.1 hypothetical protein [Sinorhizobium terangae]